ncbi:ADP-ribosylation factor-binding protein GGA1-like [Centruroides sculpturatus]|uniref:ADP-ribosylation factor-binding protein GGA1-like n=1 Tax=Centruroides sculpturatus TaxID=218467 RepID=UPI000C6EBD47|nr:ADP-ribosylation factor-binding protein GGA1-like [Centruroides sculpturatus]
MDEEDSLELLLVKVTNPLVKPNIETLQAVCLQLDKEEDGPQTSLRFLAHKIQSPQEREAMLALFVLEEMVKRCSSKFHNEIGKFRFLNEMIKVVSPKYMGNKASSNVKKKIVELMFKWSMELKHEPKIFEAYQMLKRQGVVTEDPVGVLEDYTPPNPPPPRPKNDIFEDEEKSKLLQRLLQSRNPVDLQAANQLIKTMVQQADKRMEQIARRANELETVHNNAKVLTDMLNNYKPEETSNEEKELMKELYESCERLRPKLFKLAGEVDENDEGFEDLLKANDELTAVINNYKKKIGINDVGATNGESAKDSSKNELSLMDLSSPTQEATVDTHKDAIILDEELLALGLNDSCVAPVSKNSLDATTKKVESNQMDLRQIFSSAIIDSNSPKPSMDGTSSLLANTSVESSMPYATIPSSSSSVPNITPVVPLLPAEIKPVPFSTILPQETATVMKAVSASSAVSHLVGKSEDKLVTNSFNTQEKISSSASKAFEDLDALGQSLLKQSLPPNVPLKAEFPSTPQKLPMNKIQKQDTSSPNSPVHSRSSLTLVNSQPLIGNSSLQNSRDSPSKSPLHDTSILNDITVPLETIKPGNTPPLPLHEKNGVSVVVHFGKDSPVPDVFVMVVSTLSQNANPVKKFSFHAAVPKNIKVKLQPPSATDLPSYNPILPPAAITQVMLIANPNKEKVRLKYKIMYTINEETFLDINEVDNLFGSR